MFLPTGFTSRFLIATIPSNRFKDIEDEQRYEKTTIKMELTLDQALQKGIEAHKAGKFQEADRYYTAILQANPKHPDANHNMGVLAVGVGKVEEALPFFKTALDVTPKIAQYWLSYIDALIKLDRIEDAKTVFDQAKSKGAKGDGFDQLEKQLYRSKQINNEQTDEEILGKAVELREIGKYHEAIDLLLYQLKQSPTDPNIPAILSHCYILNNDLEQAKTYLDVAKNINPNTASVGWNETRLLLKQKKVDEALIVAKRTSKLFPDDVEGIGILGSCLKSSDSFDESLKYLNKAIKLNPNYAEALINRGLIYLSKKDKANALTDLEKAHTIKPHIKEIWHLVLNLKMEVTEFENAISIAEEMVKMDPFDEKIIASIALCHQYLKNNDQAIDFYNKAIRIKPDYFEAHNNMGNALHGQHKFKEAVVAFSNSVSIKPDFAEAHNNMGLSLHHKGEPSDAIVAYKKALSIEPDNTMSWNNILFPLQAIKTQVTPGNELASYLPEEDGSNYNSISRAVLWYKLNRSADKGENITDDVLKKLSTANNQIIKNPHNHDKLSKIDTLAPKKFVAMTHCGRSGTGLLHSLIDGHPQISTLPSIYFSEYFDHSAWEKIIAGGWNEIADRFIEIYEVLFDASSSKPVDGAGKISIKNIGHRMGMTRVGDEGNETLKVDKKVFRSELNRLMGFYNELNNTTFFELVHAAYDKSINDFNEKSQIFYHIHNPDTYAHLNFLRMVPDAQRIIMVREPIQSCESWIRNRFNEDDYNSCAVRILFMLFEINNDIYERQETIGLRLEDLKDHPKQTIAALCKWMAIEETDSLYEMTAQGKKWWGDPASPDYSKEGMNPFGKTAIKRETGIIFSDRDQFVLRTLFHPFRVRFSYVEENIEQFKVDLRKIKPMLDDMFDFEKTIIERTTGDYEKFMKSGPYMYFRSGLLERWNTLNEFGTYPTMIKQLQIN